MFRKTGSGNSVVITGVIVFGLFLVMQSASALNPDHWSLMRCNHELKDVTGTVEAEGTFGFNNAVEISATEKKSEVVAFTGESPFGTYTLDEDQESYAILTSKDDSGTPFYPATAVVYLYVKFEDPDGNIWYADAATEFVLQHDADSFPPDGSWETSLSNVVTFSHGGETFDLSVADAIVTPQ